MHLQVGKFNGLNSLIAQSITIYMTAIDSARGPEFELLLDLSKYLQLPKVIVGSINCFYQGAKILCGKVA